MWSFSLRGFLPPFNVRIPRNAIIIRSPRRASCDPILPIYLYVTHPYVTPPSLLSMHPPVSCLSILSSPLRPRRVTRSSSSSIEMSSVHCRRRAAASTSESMHARAPEVDLKSRPHTVMMGDDQPHGYVARRDEYTESRARVS